MFLPGESQGWGSLVGCHLWGRIESDMTEATQQQQPGATGSHMAPQGKNLDKEKVNSEEGRAKREKDSFLIMF